MIPAIADLPPMQQETVICSIAAAAQYRIPTNVLLAVAETEGGRPGQWVRNTNGTHDVGRMQFNTAYLRSLAKYGITTDDVAAAGCYSFQLAAWRLALHIQNDSGDLWQKAANYHSKTPHFNAIYRAKLMRSGAKWGNWLTKHFNTVGVDGRPVGVTNNATPARNVTPAQNPAPSQAQQRRQKEAAYVPRLVAVAEKAGQ